MRMLIRFGKQARLRFISHLDLQRFLHMALSRTGLPIKFSEGFNPHPQMAFGSALPLFETSEYELLDVKLAAPMGRKRCEDAMRGALPADLPLLQLRLIDDKAPSVMSMVCASDYRISLSEKDAPGFSTALNAFMALPEYFAQKKSKSGVKETNIRPLVLDAKREENALLVRLMLTEKDSLKPELLLSELAKLAGAEDYSARIHRTCLYAAGADGSLVPFMDLNL